MIVTVRKASVLDAYEIADSLRPEAAAEVARVGVSTKKELRLAIRASEFAWSGFADDKIGCIWGITTDSFFSDVGVIWLVTTPLVDQHIFSFARGCQKFISEAKQQRFNRLHGTVATSFKKSQTWLKWLGFTLGAKDGNGMIYFSWEKH